MVNIIPKTTTPYHNAESKCLHQQDMIQQNLLSIFFILQNSVVEFSDQKALINFLEQQLRGLY